MRAAVRSHRSKKKCEVQSFMAVLKETFGSTPGYFRMSVTVKVGDFSGCSVSHRRLPFPLQVLAHSTTNPACKSIWALPLILHRLWCAQTITRLLSVADRIKGISIQKQELNGGARVRFQLCPRL